MLFWYIKLILPGCSSFRASSNVLPDEKYLPFKKRHSVKEMHQFPQDSSSKSLPTLKGHRYGAPEYTHPLLSALLKVDTDWIACVDDMEQAKTHKVSSRGSRIDRAFERLYKIIADVNNFIKKAVFPSWCSQPLDLQKHVWILFNILPQIGTNLAQGLFDCEARFKGVDSVDRENKLSSQTLYWKELDSYLAAYLKCVESVQRVAKERKQDMDMCSIYRKPVKDFVCLYAQLVGCGEDLSKVLQAGIVSSTSKVNLEEVCAYHFKFLKWPQGKKKVTMTEEDMQQRKSEMCLIDWFISVAKQLMKVSFDLSPGPYLVDKHFKS